MRVRNSAIKIIVFRNFYITSILHYASYVSVCQQTAT